MHERAARLRQLRQRRPVGVHGAEEIDVEDAPELLGPQVARLLVDGHHRVRAAGVDPAEPVDASSTARWQSSSEATSACTPIASAPSSSSSATVASRPSPPRATATTLGAPRSGEPRDRTAQAGRGARDEDDLLVKRSLGHLLVIPGLAGTKRCTLSGMPGWIGLPELLILLVVVLVVFGPKRLPGDGPLARTRHARVQGVGDRQRPRRRAGRPAGFDRHDPGHDARAADASARARPHRVENREAAAPSPRARRRGDARRAPRRATQPHLRGRRRARARADLHVRLPPPNHPLAEPAAPGGQASSDHVRGRRAVPDLADGLPVRGDRDHAAGDPLAGMGVPRAGLRRAHAARCAVARRVRHGADARRDPLRLLRRAPGGAQLPDELRRQPLQHPDPCEGLLLLRLAGHARGRSRLPGAALHPRSRPASASSPRDSCAGTGGSASSR